MMMMSLTAEEEIGPVLDEDKINRYASWLAFAVAISIIKSESLTFSSKFGENRPRCLWGGELGFVCLFVCGFV
jgi:hypothetical protein